ncbi:SGNH/GDSL hydrolase family protein [Pirellulaceae bacterium SH449]
MCGLRLCKSTGRFLIICLTIAAFLSSMGQGNQPPSDGTILFLGDSITYAGEYVNHLETAWRIHHPGREARFVNAGLPSETVSGLSEPGHAGGAFPRPDLHERLARVLDEIRPTTVVACYGMNDGIYYPLSEARFQAYQQGIQKLIEQTKAREIKLILMTPAFFDNHPIRARLLPAGLDSYPQPFIGYDDVLETYATWLLSRQTEELLVIDIHAAMKRAVLARRKDDPNFTFASDGVHPNSDGHQVIAQAIAKAWGLPVELLHAKDDSVRAKLYELVSKRQHILKHAWLTKTKHTRPGIEIGLPMDQVEAKVKTIEVSIANLLVADR